MGEGNFWPRNLTFPFMDYCIDNSTYIDFQASQQEQPAFWIEFNF